MFTRVGCGQLGAAKDRFAVDEGTGQGSKERLSLWTGCTVCTRVLRAVRVRLSVSTEHKKHLFHSVYTPSQKWACPALKYL